MEPSKTCLKFLLLALLSLVAFTVAAQEKSAAVAIVNPPVSLAIPGNPMRVEIQATALPANSNVFLAVILDSQLTLLKPSQKSDGNNIYGFSFPAPLYSLKYFPLVTSEQSILLNGEPREIIRNCIPASENSQNQPNKKTDSFTQAKNLEQEISNLEEALNKLLQIKSKLKSSDA